MNSGSHAALEDAIDDLCPRVMAVVTNPREGNHVGEWAKKPSCWDAVSRVRWTVPRDLQSELLEHPLDEEALAGGTEGDEGARDEVTMVPADEWYALEQWAKETHNLVPAQRQLAQYVGRRLELDQEVPEPQAVQALHARNEALSLGFTPGA